MSWWGKLLGGTFGFMLGGPLGALIGAALGHNFDRGLKGIDELEGEAGAGPEAGDRERVQMAFFTATFSVMGYVAKVDGQVSREEIRLAQAVMDDWQLSADMRRAAIRLFDEGKQPRFPLDEVIRQFRGECQRRTNLMRLFVEIQLQAAYADGVLHPDEELCLLHICRLLGLPKGEYRRMEALVRASVSAASGSGAGGWQSESNWRGGRGGDRASGRAGGQRTARGGDELSVEQAYAILGVGPKSSDGEVKRAYRRLMSQHHPDKLVAKGLPEEMVAAATAKTRQIRRAWEVVKALRGI